MVISNCSISLFGARLHLLLLASVWGASSKLPSVRWSDGTSDGTPHACSTCFSSCGPVSIACMIARESFPSSALISVSMPCGDRTVLISGTIDSVNVDQSLFSSPTYSIRHPRITFWQRPAHGLACR
uniref:Putative secreted protein n=1 Tax=Anopheles darlingi TaxID=43151 RepID=A0A2M4DHE4_ANODA